jgi:hypothetical protein
MGDMIVAIEKKKFCRKTYMKEYAAKHPNKYYDKNRSKASMAKYRLNHPVGFLLYAAKHKASKSNIPFTITEADIEHVTHCPVLGSKLEYQSPLCGSGKRLNNSATLEIIQSDLGFVKGNVIIVSWLAKRLKNEATVKELSKVCDFYSNV